MNSSLNGSFNPKAEVLEEGTDIKMKDNKIIDMGQSVIGKTWYTESGYANSENYLKAVSYDVKMYSKYMIDPFKEMLNIWNISVLLKYFL